MASYRVSGRVINREPPHAVAGLRVQVWDKDLIVDDLVGSAIVDVDGRFVVEFDESHFRELFLDRSPDLFFKVYQDSDLVTSTEDSVIWNASPGETTVEIKVSVMQRPERAQQIGIDEFTEATFSAVLRAIEARPGDLKGKLPGPIIYGIIWYPEWLESLQQNITTPQ